MGMDSNAIMGYVQHYQRNIERAQDNEQKLLHCLGKLYKLPIQIEHLSETGIGKTVNALRKYDGEIGVASKALITKWKTMVASANQKRHEEEEEEIVYDQAQATSTVESSNKHQQEYETNHRPSENDESMNKYKNHQSRHEQHHKEKSDKHKFKESGEKSHKHLHRHPESSSERIERKERERLEKEKGKEAGEIKRERSEKSSREHGEHKKPKSHKEHKENNKMKNDNVPSTSNAALAEMPIVTQKEKPESEKQEKSNKSEKHKKHKHKHDKSNHSKDDKQKLSKHNNKESSKKRTHEQDVPKEEVVKKKVKLEPKIEDNNDEQGMDGIDSSMGANFADVLGALNMPGSSRKTKKPPQNNTQTKQSSSATITKSSNKTISVPVTLDKKPALLSSTVKLEPLDPNLGLELPTISNNYKPMPLNQTVMDCVFNTNSSSATKTPVRTLTDAEALQHGISSKTMRTKIYSGAKSGQMYQVPSLFDLCIRMLQKNIDALEYTGGVPFEVLKPVLERATPEQLYQFEEFNPYIMEDSDILWKLHVQRKYRTGKRQEMESWREMFLRCQEEEEERLSRLTQTIKQKEKIIAAPVRKTQLAFVDSMVKPPRNIARKQDIYGTRSKPIATPASRVAALSSVTPNAARAGDARLRVVAATRDTAQVSHSVSRPKKAPLMAKTLQFMRGQLKR